MKRIIGEGGEALAQDEITPVWQGLRWTYNDRENIRGARAIDPL